MGKRTLIGEFIHTSWTNLSLRAGKYRHLGTKDKNKCYRNISVEFTRDEFKQWCINNKDIILTLNRPSIDRIDSQKNYTLNNIQITELKDNIKRKRIGNPYVNGSKSNIIRGVRFKDNRWVARITINYKEIYLGSFLNKEEALSVFYSTYLRYYNKAPW